MKTQNGKCSRYRQNLCLIGNFMGNAKTFFIFRVKWKVNRVKELYLFDDGCVYQNVMLTINQTCYWLWGNEKNFSVWHAKLKTHLKRFLRIPMSLKSVFQRFFQLLTKQIHSPSRQFIVQIRYDEIECHLYFYVHFWLLNLLCWRVGKTKFFLCLNYVQKTNRALSQSVK